MHGVFGVFGARVVWFAILGNKFGLNRTLDDFSPVALAPMLRLEPPTSLLLI